MQGGFSIAMCINIDWLPPPPYVIWFRGFFQVSFRDCQKEQRLLYSTSINYYRNDILLRFIHCSFPASLLGTPLKGVGTFLRADFLRKAMEHYV